MTIFLRTILVGSLFVGGCRTGQGTLEKDELSSLAAHKLKTDSISGFISESDRKAYLEKGEIFIGTRGKFPTVEELLEGAKVSAPPFEVGGTNFCHYFKRKNLGTNPKFRCYHADEEQNYITTKGKIVSKTSVARIDSDGKLFSLSGKKLGKADEIKIKYFPSKKARDNIRRYGPRSFRLFRDRYTEVISTRLLWAMGFAADRMWPTSEVRCFRCPYDPYKKPDETPEEVVIFPDAAIERQYSGKKMESKKTKKGQGWNWQEVSEVYQGKGAALEKQNEFEGLLVILTLLNHVSNRPQQQRLVCQKKSITPEGGCGRSVLVVQDLGSTFGHRKLEWIDGEWDSTSSKGSLKNWSEHEIWTDREKCILNMRFYPDQSDNFLTFSIHKGGHDFIKERLGHLTREHVKALFKYGKLAKGDVELRKKLEEKFKGEDVSELALEAWTDAFMAKVRQINSVQCPI